VKPDRHPWRQFLFVFLCATAVVMVLVRLEVVEHLAYAVQKGRLRAISEVLPTANEVADYNEPNRRVAEYVTPAVVHIEPIQFVSRAALNLPTVRTVDPSRNDAPTEGAIDPDDDFRTTHPWMFDKDDPEADDEDDEVEYEPSDVDDVQPPDTVSIQSGLGSGFIFDADNGYILTNEHVIAHADAIDIILADGRRFRGRVVGADAASDLAVLEIDADRLHELRLGGSDDLRVGDEVFALGNPFGLDGTFSRGIVSAMGRSIGIRNVRYQGFIQTDAVINPGNSGGPLVNRSGDVIGVNTAIASDSGSYMGVGFAIPSARVAALLPQLIAGGAIVRGFLGVGTEDVRLNRERAIELGWSRPDGVIVREVRPNTPADRADLRDDDIIFQVADAPVGNTTELMDVVADIRPGTEVTIHYFRDGAERTLTLIVSRRPDNA
jgi:S1-C subfamily serine protease